MDTVINRLSDIESRRFCDGWCRWRKKQMAREMEEKTAALMRS